MLTIPKPGAPPKSQTDRRAEIIRVQEELEALDRIGDAVENALYSVLELTKTASTNPAKFRSALVVGVESSDALTKQLGIIRSEIARADAYLTEITRTPRQQRAQIVADGWRPSDILAVQR